MPSGSLIQLQKSNPSGDRDWRNAAILPLHIVQWTATLQNNQQAVLLQWKVVNEWQVKQYTVEYSINGTQFNVLPMVTALNVGSYTYQQTHFTQSISADVIYYRIKQEDKEGKIYYTNTLVVRKQMNPSFVAYPNPFSSFINCTYSSAVQEKATMQFINHLGQVVYSKSVWLNQGMNNFQLTQLQQIPSGQYQLQLKTANTHLQTTVIKQ